MTEVIEKRRNEYDKASPKWGDKMRALGYYDGYLGFLSAPGLAESTAKSVIDIGAGTAAFAEAWVAINGAPNSLTLLEPSLGMLERADAALRVRGVQATKIQAHLGEHKGKYDEALVAHVIEHCPDPLNALQQIGALVAPGGKLRLVVSKPHWCNAIIWFQWRHRDF